MIVVVQNRKAVKDKLFPKQKEGTHAWLVFVVYIKVYVLEPKGRKMSYILLSYVRDDRLSSFLQ